MKIVLHLEIEEEDISLLDKDRKTITKSEMQELLMAALNEWINEIDDWCQVYDFIEDENDKNRKE